MVCYGWQMYLTCFLLYFCHATSSRAFPEQIPGAEEEEEEGVAFQKYSRN